MISSNFILLRRKEILSLLGCLNVSSSQLYIMCELKKMQGHSLEVEIMKELCGERLGSMET